MNKALKATVVPVLRNLGFTGSFPHFRRRQPKRIDLLTFQFDRYGGGFVIEIVQCDTEGFTNHWGEHIPPEKVTAWDVPQRVRVQPGAGSGTEGWFRYDLAKGDAFTRTATSVIPFLEQIEKTFDDLSQIGKRRDGTETPGGRSL